MIFESLSVVSILLKQYLLMIQSCALLRFFMLYYSSELVFETPVLVNDFLNNKWSLKSLTMLLSTETPVIFEKLKKMYFRFWFYRRRQLCSVNLTIHHMIAHSDTTGYHERIELFFKTVVKSYKLCMFQFFLDVFNVAYKGQKTLYY